MSFYAGGHAYIKPGRRLRPIFSFSMVQGHQQILSNSRSFDIDYIDIDIKTQPFVLNALFLIIFLFYRKFHENCIFLAKGCILEQIVRKQTPLKNKFFLPTATFSKAWKWQQFDFGLTFTHF